MEDEEHFEGEDGEQIELTPSQMEQLHQQMMEEGYMDEDGEGEFEGEYEQGDDYEGEDHEDGNQYFEGPDGEYYQYEGEGEGEHEQYEEQDQEQDQQDEEEHDQEEGEEHYQGQSSTQQHKHHKDQTQDDNDLFDRGDILHEDLLRKVRRHILDNLNSVRDKEKLQPFYIELMLSYSSKHYAEYLCDNSQTDTSLYNNQTRQQYWDNQCIDKFYKPLKEKDKHFPKDCYLCTIVSNYEEDATLSQKTIFDFFMELGYLFLEVEEDKQSLMSPQMNHIGIGVEFDQNQVTIVLAVTKRALAISRVQEIGGAIEIRGKVLEEKQGIFSVRIVDFEGNNEISKIGPEKIDFSRQTKEFVAIIEGVSIDNSIYPQKLIELWNRQSPDSIPYKKVTREKLSYKYLDPQMKIPCYAYPDPRFLEEDLKAEMEERERQKLEEDLKREREAQELRNQVQDDQDKHEEDDNLDSSEQDSNADLQDNFKKQEPREPVITNKEISEDLELAIGEANNQFQEFSQQNENLQERIKQILLKDEKFKDRSNEMAMNEHKYLNTLAHVHQIRLDLKQTQERYNKMAMELQQKLEEKQKKCQEIKFAFLELKREVAKKAAYSRNDKSIKSEQIDEWEQKEMEKGQILQGLRLDILRLRNQYIKNTKVLKKKEELAEGLHLIDFEQLKIENQTLNEKIEERNEDLHKLKKKNTTTIQYLTHTREKLVFIQKKNEILKEKNLEYAKEQNNLRDELSVLKGKKDEKRKELSRLNQYTGIQRSEMLKSDFTKLFNLVKELQEEKQTLKEKHEHMSQVIKQYKLQLKEQEQQMQYMEGV